MNKKVWYNCINKTKDRNHLLPPDIIQQLPSYVAGYNTNVSKVCNIVLILTLAVAITNPSPLLNPLFHIHKFGYFLNHVCQPLAGMCFIPFVCKVGTCVFAF